MIPVGGPGSLARIRSNLGEERFLTTLKINRVDGQHAALMDSLIVADTDASFLDLSPLPARLPNVTGSKLLAVALRVQAFGAYEGGRLVRWGPISSGMASSPTPAGLFYVNWRARHHVSTVDSNWIMPWTVNVDAKVGIALHQYALPGRPASHCCIRLMEDDARWIYEWVDAWTLTRDGREVLVPGTPVAIVGDYMDDAPPPWRRLPADSASTIVTSWEIEAVVATPKSVVPANAVAP
jgi:hypothetical protein